MCVRLASPVGAHVHVGTAPGPDELFDAQLFGHRERGILVGRQPLTAHLDIPAVALLGQQPPADPVTCFQHHHVAPGVHESLGGGQSGRSGADDDDISLFSHAAHHIAVPGCVNAVGAQ